MGQCHHKGESLSKTPALSRPEGNGGMTRRRMASEWQINSFPGLHAVKMIRQQMSLTNRLTYQSTTLTNKRRQCRTRAEDHRLKSGLPLTRGLDIHKNPPVSVTKLTLSLRVGFISSHFLTEKLFQVHSRAITGPPKVSLMLEPPGNEPLGNLSY